jgi:hypothetical protein
MMQMLGAGGMELLCDDARPPDADNPRGYFEYEPVKRTAQDASWVPRARGKAVKVIYALLRSLPPGERYRVILMERRIEDVLASQDAMLRRRGEGTGSVAPERLRALLERQLGDVFSWMGRQPGFRVLRVPFDDLVARPTGPAAETSRFLGGGLHVERMAEAADPSLHWQPSRR